MELREPKRKRKSRVSLQSPFPVPVESITGIPASCATWKICTGRYNGDSVVVDKSEEVFKLYYQGFFGKGSLSRSFPEYGKVIRGIPPFIRQRQLELHGSWAKLQNTNSHTSEKDDKIGDGVPCNIQKVDASALSSKSVNNEDDGDGSSQPKKRAKLSESYEEEHGLPQTESSETSCTEDESQQQSPGDRSPAKAVCNQQEARMLLVVPDSDEDDVDINDFVANVQPKLEADPFPIAETLHLSLEEAFFLSYALGCLKVIDLHGNNLSLINMWQLFCDSQKDFVQCYVVYHYFRAKNWVVKPGLKFGGDFVLYKQGPPFYHASYIIKVEVIDGRTQEKVLAPGFPALGWTRLMGLHRLAETAGKEVLLCQVMWPTDLPQGALRSPRVLSRFTVRELLIRRWVTSKEREREWDDL